MNGTSMRTQSHHLLKVDMEPFGPGDERDNEKRHRRRLQKQTETPRKVKHLSLVQSGEYSPRSEDRTSQAASDVDEDSFEVNRKFYLNTILASLLY